MQLNKLISLREGQRKLVSRLLVEFKEELSKSEYKKLLEILTEKADAIKALNDKIVNHDDIGNLETGLVVGEEYSIDLELKLQKLRERINQTAGITEGPTLQPQNENQNHRTTTESENAPPTLPEAWNPYISAKNHMVTCLFRSYEINYLAS